MFLFGVDSVLNAPFWKSKERQMREELGMIGVRGSYDMKLPLPLSSLKSLPLAPPQCLQTVRDQLAKCPPPSLGLQVPFQKSLKGYSCFSNMGKQCI